MYDVIVGQWLVWIGALSLVAWIAYELATAPWDDPADSEWDARDRAMRRHPAGKGRTEDEL